MRFWGVIFVGLLWIPAYEMFFSDGTRHSPTSAWMVAGGFICFAIAAQVGRDWAVETMRCWSWFAAALDSLTDRFDESCTTHYMRCAGAREILESIRRHPDDWQTSGFRGSHRFMYFAPNGGLVDTSSTDWRHEPSGMLLSISAYSDLYIYPHGQKSGPSRAIADGIERRIVRLLKKIEKDRRAESDRRFLQDKLRSGTVSV